MDAMVLQRVGEEWSRTLEGLVFRGLIAEPTGVRVFLGPRRGARGAIHGLNARWPEPLWLSLEETALPRERLRHRTTQRYDGTPLRRVWVPPGDRRIRLELGEENQNAGFLEIEVWPPGNLIFVGSENQIIWASRRKPASTLRGAIESGKPYSKPPAPFRADPKVVTAADLEKHIGVDRLRNGEASEIADILRHQWSGVMGPIADNIVQDWAELRSQESPDPELLEKTAERYRSWAETAFAKEGRVLGLRWVDKHRNAMLVHIDSALIPTKGIEVSGPWVNWSSAAQSLAAELPEAISNEEIADAKTRLKRVDRSLRAARFDLARARGGPEQRRKGEALLASLHLVKAGEKLVRVDDPADPEKKISIELDVRRKPHENANRYFNLARKAERALDTIPARIRVLEEENKKAFELVEALDRGRRPAGVDPPTIHGSVTPGRPARSALGPTLNRGDEIPLKMQPRRYKSKEGWEIWIGKSNESNDYLTHRLARGEDWWFHVQGSPGSHVVLRRGKGKDSPSRETVHEVASWTAFFSKQRNAGTVPVNYTQKKYVRKPRGAKPGLASIQREKSVFVKPVEPPKESQISEASEA